MVALLLLVVANIFMTIAWYGHLRFLPEGRFPLLAVIFISWGIALFEYFFQVPANRIGYRTFSATQLKIFQEAISIAVFVVLAVLVLNERPRWNHGVAFVLVGLAAALAVRK
ncbi:MAG TPA: DMT family protein [Trueperaceae bacterium]|nr:DMT family protein [Trueperaceae bacterium]